MALEVVESETEGPADEDEDEVGTKVSGADMRGGQGRRRL